MSVTRLYPVQILDHPEDEASEHRQIGLARTEAEAQSIVMSYPYVVRASVCFVDFAEAYCACVLLACPTPWNYQPTL